MSFIPPGAVQAYAEWSEPVVEWERRYAGAAYSIWNEYLTVDPGGAVRSGTEIPGVALLPRRGYIRVTSYPQTPFRVENRPGASPVSVPAVLGIIYAARQRPRGAATRIPNALQAHGWTLCGHLQQTGLGTYCPPVGAETRRHETLRPALNVPTVEFQFQAARPGRKGQVNLAGTEPEKVPERERPPVHTAGKQVSIEQIIPLDQNGP